jgi:dTDP-glucose pyrophosphorylase
MISYKDHLIKIKSSIENALIQLDYLGKDAILFVINDEGLLAGALTDGDIRRGLIKGVSIKQNIELIIQANPRFIRKGETDVKKIIKYRENNFRIIPVLDEYDKVVNVINFRELKSYLPIDAVIMAGGRGQRLSPLTDKVPKPLLIVGDKPIIDHNLTRLSIFGIDDFWISLKYLGDQIETYFGNGESRNINVQYIWEDEPMGTIGAISKVDNFKHDFVLVTNSDLLTNIDYEHFFLEFLEKDADMSVVTIPYQVRVPYAVLETENDNILNFTEKPTYTYYSNGGIYLMKKSALGIIPKNKLFNATDLMEQLIKMGLKVTSYPLVGYWLDIGNPEDYKKAQYDIKNIKF